jgi:hypothetical protein
VVVVGAVMSEELAATLYRLRREGHYVHVLKTAATVWEQDLGPIPVTELATQMEALEAQLAADLGDLRPRLTGDELATPRPEPAVVVP